MLAVTPGEPAGIGADLVVAFAQTQRQEEIVVVGSADLLQQRAALLNLPLTLCSDVSSPTLAAGQITVLHVPLEGDVSPGKPQIDNVQGVLASLDAAIAGCLTKKFSGLVTGPMQKSIVNEAGIVFSGHTEYLAERADVEDVVMLLVAGNLRIALATTHLPLANVASALTPTLLKRRISILNEGLRNQFGLEHPQIFVAGLNPHAGEQGHLGREEIEVISPVLKALEAQGVNVHGPYPADTLFTPKFLDQADAFLAMYHDQGLPVLKFAGFGEAVNVTLGLPFVRTSVDHGTALDIAGSGNAQVGSFLAAIELASKLVRHN
ncbi:MAG: 4-hydroxythreonine-4-phosphate dehydrogenase [Limisphaerales bacterium]